MTCAAASQSHPRPVAAAIGTGATTATSQPPSRNQVTLRWLRNFYTLNNIATSFKIGDLLHELQCQHGVPLPDRASLIVCSQKHRWSFDTTVAQVVQLHRVARIFECPTSGTDSDGRGRNDTRDDNIVRPIVQLDVRFRQIVATQSSLKALSQQMISCMSEMREPPLKIVDQAIVVSRSLFNRNGCGNGGNGGNGGDGDRPRAVGVIGSAAAAFQTALSANVTVPPATTATDYAATAHAATAHATTAYTRSAPFVWAPFGYYTERVFRARVDFLLAKTVSASLRDMTSDADVAVTALDIILSCWAWRKTHHWLVHEVFTGPPAGTSCAQTTQHCMLFEYLQMVISRLPVNKLAFHSYHVASQGEGTQDTMSRIIGDMSYYFKLAVHQPAPPRRVDLRTYRLLLSLTTDIYAQCINGNSIVATHSVYHGLRTWLGDTLMGIVSSFDRLEQAAADGQCRGACVAGSYLGPAMPSHNDMMLGVLFPALDICTPYSALSLHGSAIAATTADGSGTQNERRLHISAEASTAIFGRLIPPPPPPQRQIVHLPPLNLNGLIAPNPTVATTGATTTTGASASASVAAPPTYIPLPPMVPPPAELINTVFLYISRSDLLATSFYEVMAIPESHMLSESTELCVCYERESAIGAGVGRDWVVNVFEDLFSADMGLFESSDTDPRIKHIASHGHAIHSRDIAAPSPFEFITFDKWMHFVGRMIAIAFRLKASIGYHFSAAFWAAVQGTAPSLTLDKTLDMVAELRPDIKRVCDTLEAMTVIDHIGIRYGIDAGTSAGCHIKHADEQIASLMLPGFFAPHPHGEFRTRDQDADVVLLRGLETVEIASHNVRLFAYLRARHAIGIYDTHAMSSNGNLITASTHVRNGMLAMSPRKDCFALLLASINSSLLNAVLGGQLDVEWGDIYDAARMEMSGCVQEAEAQKVVTAFWAAVADMTPERRRQLLNFWTAMPSLVTGSNAPKLQLLVCCHRSAGMLPRANTCYKQLVLFVPCEHSVTADSASTSTSTSDGVSLRRPRIAPRMRECHTRGCRTVPHTRHGERCEPAMLPSQAESGIDVAMLINQALDLTDTAMHDD